MNTELCWGEFVQLKGIITMLEFPFQRVICELALEGDYPINVQYFQAHLSLPLFLWSFESPFSHATKSSLSLSTYLSLYIYIPLIHSLGAVISECRQRQPNDVTLSAGLFFLQVVPLIWPTPTPDFESELESKSELESESSRSRSLRGTQSQSQSKTGAS